MLPGYSEVFARSVEYFVLSGYSKAFAAHSFLLGRFEIQQFLPTNHRELQRNSSLNSALEVVKEEHRNAAVDCNALMDILSFDSPDTIDTTHDLH